jgi:hypothetical protein
MILNEISHLLLNVHSNVNELLDAGKDADDTVKTIKWINVKDFWELLIRFSFNLGMLVLIAKGLYYSKTKRKDFLFSFIMMGTIIFLLCFTLNNVKLQMGFAFGLFAIFGIMRYRTDGIPIKEMTYLFVIIAVSVINSLVSKKISYAELLLANVVIVGVLVLLERVWLLRNESFKRVLYEKIDLIKPEKNAELISDLEERMGIKISRVEIVKVDFMRDVADLLVFYFESEQTAISGLDYTISNNSDSNL